MSVTEIWEKWKSNRALAREFNSLNMDQREELARDICVSEDVLERLFQAGGRGRELGRLMYALSLDPEENTPPVGGITRDMTRVCAECAMVRRCQRELEEGSARTNYHEYCPNASPLDELIEMQAQSRLISRMNGRRT